MNLKTKIWIPKKFVILVEGIFDKLDDKHCHHTVSMKRDQPVVPQDEGSEKKEEVIGKKFEAEKWLPRISNIVSISLEQSTYKTPSPFSGEEHAKGICLLRIDNWFASFDEYFGPNHMLTS